MPSKKQSGILLVEDHPLMRQGIRSLVSDAHDFGVMAEVGTITEAREIFAKSRFDLILLDLTLPDGSGLELISEFRAKRPETKIVVLTMHNEGPYLTRAISLGADGYVVKDMVPEKLLETLRSVMRGERCFFISKTEGVASGAGAAGVEGKGLDALSAREKKVMTALLNGKTLTEIAGELDLSVKTVFTYRVRLLKKLGLKNNAELIRAYGVLKL